MSSDHTSENGKVSEADEPSRRDFIYIATGAFAAAGVAAAAWPMVAHMKPAPDARKVQTIEVDLSLIPEGGEIKLLWMGRPIIVRHRTAVEIEAAQRDDTVDMIDPETDQERLRPMKDGRYNPKYLIVNPACTHFGCITTPNAGDYDGRYCICHGAHFDTSGRVRKGPAPLNLKVPPYHYQNETTVLIGYNK